MSAEREHHRQREYVSSVTCPVWKNHAVVMNATNFRPPISCSGLTSGFTAIPAPPAV